MARREKRWERPLDQLREEFKRLEGELDDAADLAAEQEREIVRLGERIERLEDELEEARRTAGADDDDRRPDAGAPRGRPGWADQVMTSAPFRAQDCC